MTDYNSKSYGRNTEVASVYQLLESKRDITMPGPRRLGKTFLLHRLASTASDHGWTAVRVELAGCNDSQSVFRELCNEIGKKRSGGAKAVAFIVQRLMQFASPRTEAGGSWYQPFIGVDHQSFFERVIQALHEDKDRRWVILIDELPIFLKALHDKGPAGVASARDFMNNMNRLREKYNGVRWMITGSIGIEPLATAGDYMGALIKFTTFKLHPLDAAQAKDYIQDRALDGYLPHRKEITDAEARALIFSVGWLAPFYLDALALQIEGPLALDDIQAKIVVDIAVEKLMSDAGPNTFGIWEEHLRKHYNSSDRAIAVKALGALSRNSQGLEADGLLATIERPELTAEGLRLVLMRLTSDGFLAVDDWKLDSPRCYFLNPLLRLWWHRARPQANA